MTRWLIAFIITLASIYYQRTTGPTYPLKGSTTLDGQIIRYRLERSHDSDGNQPVAIQITDSTVAGEVIWRRYPTDVNWEKITMERHDGTLIAALPPQPPAGKLEYTITLKKGETQIRLPEQGAVVTRFKGHVPAYFLISHIVLMFAAMLLSVRAGAEVFGKQTRPRVYVWATLITLFAGGMVLGSIVQKYAFGAYWTGFPFGMDLTDNKTLIALLGWIAAAFAVEKNRQSKILIFAAALLMLGVYAIPHSLVGSELKH